MESLIEEIVFLSVSLLYSLSLSLSLYDTLHTCEGMIVRVHIFFVRFNYIPVRPGDYRIIFAFSEATAHVDTIEFSYLFSTSIFIWYHYFCLLPTHIHCFSSSYFHGSLLSL